MLDEEKLTSMLKTHTQHVAPTPELWDRIARGAGGRPQQRRWLALPFGLRRGLEVVAVCAVLGAIAILPVLRHGPLPDAPGGAPKSTQTPPIAQKVEGVPLAADVSKAYFGGFPTTVRTLPLDEATVTKVLGWLNGAEVVGHDADVFRNHGQDFYLVMALRNGNQVTVRRAEDCVVTKTADSMHTTCHAVQDHVNLIVDGNGGTRLRSPELWNWLRSDGNSSAAGSHGDAPSASAKGANVEALNAQFGGISGMTFTNPSSPPKITPEQARAIAAQQIGQPPADAKVTVDYVLMSTSSGMGMEGKKWENYPVYLVTYDGIKMGPPSGPVPQGPAPTPQPDAKGTITAFIDANTGEWIQGVAR